ncbi:MAG: stage V sporulation protein AB [Defluviitaleaceae bacterium]|nr:stage V sporulation protein AB [Defluviitaleaceae bacterium]
MDIVRHTASVTIGFASGLVIAGAVYAFLTIVGVVPRLAQKTRTTAQIKGYESALVLGGIFGTLTGIFRFYLPIGTVGTIAVSFANGIFFGCLAMSLAEVLNVIPIFSRRARIQRGMFFIVLAIAVGKLAGSLLYFLVPGFFDVAAM